MTDLNPEQFMWMRGEDIAAIFNALPEGSVRFVGGCVRNALMGVEVGDIDLATTLEPTKVAAALDVAKIRYVPTGIEHGTLTVVIDGKPFEITSLRKDVETDGRHAVVAWFLAWYGGGAKVDAAALKACRENRRGLKKLSAERVWSELKKLLLARNPSRAVQIMLTNEILDTLLPEASNAEGLSKMVALESREAIAPDPLLRLMAMSAREPLQMALLCKRLKMSTKETNRLRAWSDSSVALDPHAEDSEKIKAIYLASKQVVIDRARVRAAGEEDTLMSVRWMSFADVLEALKALWVRSNFTADRDKLLMALKLINR